MKLSLLIAGLASACTAFAQPGWFTVVGDPLGSAVNTVQVDPDAVTGTPASPGAALNLRVNRSMLRSNWDGIPYRSYESRVVFDCQAHRASYVAARFYMEPLWQGEAHAVVDYAGAPKPMLFRDMTPNPTARIVRAACRQRSN